MRVVRVLTGYALIGLAALFVCAAFLATAAAPFDKPGGYWDALWPLFLVLVALATLAALGFLLVSGTSKLVPKEEKK